MEYGIVAILIVLLLTAYVIVQETRAQMHWRGLVQDGDVEAVRQLVDEEAENWRTARVPKGTPALLWHGVQTVNVTDVSGTAARVSCNAEGEYALTDGKRTETSSPLNEGMKITLKLAEMLLYDVPNVKFDQVQIDVYTSFRDESGRSEAQCILSTKIDRSRISLVDWDVISGPDFITLNEGRFSLGGGGSITVEPFPWVDDPVRRN